MSNREHEELNPANETQKTPLDLVREQQSTHQHSQDVLNKQPQADSDLPGHGIPSDKRKHPQRQQYQ